MDADPGAGATGEVHGSGRLACTGLATLSIEICLQWRTASTDYTELSCATADEYDSMVKQDLSFGCGVGTGKLYRARLHSQKSGGAVIEDFTNEISCN